MAFSGFLKKGTDTIINFGPFVASADGETAQAALTINQTDVLLNKAGGTTWASKAATGGATAVASGMYMVNIGTGDSNTEGILSVFSHVSPALYVKQSYIVLPGLVYDSLIGGTDFLQTDSHQASGTNILTLLDVAASSRVAATAAVFDKVDVNVSSRLAATATEVGRMDVNTSSRLAATAAALTFLDVAISSRMAGTATVSAQFATATQVTDKTGYTATVSDKTGFELAAAYDLAKTAAQATAVESVLQKVDVTTSSRLAATATEVGRIDVTLSTRATSAVLATVSASAADVWDFSRGNKTLDITGNGWTAWKSDGTTVLWSYTMSGANPASAVPAYIKSTRN